MKNLYKEWRLTNEELGAKVDCGEVMVRSDFSHFAGLDKEISFEDMFKLEKDYERK